MKNKSIAFLLFAFALVVMAISPAPVHAQGPVPYVFDTTIPVDSFVKSSIDAWLAVTPPANAIYYAITYTQQDGMDTLVSLVAVDLTSPDDAWSLTDVMEDGRLIWLGTVVVHVGGQVEAHSREPQTRGVGKIAAPALWLSGGGSDLVFPWDQGKAMLYSKKGVIRAGLDPELYDMKAVEFTSTTAGVGLASDAAYAAADGTIDFMCDDNISVAVRMSGGNNLLSYAFLEGNATLVLDAEFEQGERIGTMKHGSWAGICGIVLRSNNSWGIRFGFEPANDVFRVGPCVLSIESEGWRCANGKIANPGDYLANNTLPGLPPGEFPDDGSYDPDNPHASAAFWDYILVGLVTIFDRSILKLLPEHTSSTTPIMGMVNVARFVLKVDFVLLKANFNLGPAMTALFAGLGVRLIFGLIWIGGVVLRIIKGVPGVP